jgi:hypothetical protein
LAILIGLKTLYNDGGRQHIVYIQYAVRRQQHIVYIQYAVRYSNKQSKDKNTINFRGATLSPTSYNNLDKWSTCASYRQQAFEISTSAVSRHPAQLRHFL